MYNYSNKNNIQTVNPPANSNVRQGVTPWGTNYTSSTTSSSFEASTRPMVDRKVNPLFKEVDEELKKLKSQFEFMKVDPSSSTLSHQQQQQSINKAPGPMTSYSYQNDGIQRRPIISNLQSSYPAIQETQPGISTSSRKQSQDIQVITQKSTEGRSTSIQSDRGMNYSNLQTSSDSVNRSFPAQTTTVPPVRQNTYQSSYNTISSSSGNNNNNYTARPLQTASAQSDRYDYKSSYQNNSNSSSSGLVLGNNTKTFLSNSSANQNNLQSNKSSTTANYGNTYSGSINFRNPQNIQSSTSTSNAVLNSDQNANVSTAYYQSSSSSSVKQKTSTSSYSSSAGAVTATTAPTPMAEPVNPSNNWSSSDASNEKQKPATAEPKLLESASQGYFSISQQNKVMMQSSTPLGQLNNTRSNIHLSDTRSALGAGEQNNYSVNEATYASRQNKAYSSSFSASREKSISIRNDETDLKEKSENLAISLEVANKQNHTYRIEIQKLKAKLMEIDGLKAQNDELRKKLLEKDEKIHHFEHQNEESVSAILRHQRTIKGLEAQIAYCKQNHGKSAQPDTGVTSVFNQALKSHIEEVQRYKNKISLLEEQITRLEDNARTQKSQLDSMKNEVEIEKLKRMTELKNASTNYQIEAVAKDNEISSLKKVVASLDDKLKYILKEEKKKDEFLMNHLRGKCQNPEDKQYVTEFFKQYEDVPKINISEMMMQQRLDNENLRKELREVKEALEVERSIRKYLH